jgi:hypothetical protein
MYTYVCLEKIDNYPRKIMLVPKVTKSKVKAIDLVVKDLKHFLWLWGLNSELCTCKAGQCKKIVCDNLSPKIT